MKRYSQLTHLVWDFYREDWEDLERLRVLGDCRICRRWGVFRIECPGNRTAEAVASVLALIEAPVKQLRLAKRIKIFANKELFVTYPTPLKRIPAQ